MSDRTRHDAVDPLSFLRPVFPGLTDDDLEEWLRYAEETWRVLQAIRSDPERYAHFRALTKSRQTPNG